MRISRRESDVCSGVRLFRIDAALDVGPAALVGRQVRVFWPEDIAWYLGRVASFDVEECTHRVRFPAARDR